MNTKQIGEPSRIKSQTFDIREVSNKGQKYFVYYKKNTINEELNKYFIKDLSITHNCQHLRKYKQNADGDNYKAFEYLGEYKILRDLFKPKEETLLKIISDLVSALMILHSNSLIGRCFNIDNIILINGQTPVLMEFGYYPKMDYKVPEQIYYTQLNEKIDVFLLGRVIYYLIVGKELPIYDLDNFGELEEKIYMAIAETNYSQNLKLFMQQLLQKNRNNRIDFIKLAQKFDTPNSSKLLSFYQNEFQKYSMIINDLLKERQAYDIDLNNSIPFSISSIEGSNNQLGQLTKGPQITLIQQPNVQGNHLNPPDPPSDEDEDLSPPFIDSQHILNNSVKIDSDAINNELLNLLPFYFDSSDKYQSIWDKIFFSIYRFGLLKKLNEMILNFKKLSDDLCLWKTCFALNKISIVLKQEFVNDLNQDKNIFFIQENDWKEFIAKDKDYKKLKQNLSYLLTQEKSQFIGLTFSQLYKGYQIYKQQPPQDDQFLNNNLTYGIFEDYKISYRLILRDSLFFFEKGQGRDYSLIKLLHLICMKINNICDIDMISTNFQYVAQVLNLQQVNSIKELEFFFNNKNEIQFDELYSKLKDVYFSQNQQ